MTTNKRIAALAAVVILTLCSSAYADAPEQPPPGMGKFFLFLKQPPAVPQGQPPKKIVVPDVAKLGGRVLETRDLYRVIFLPLAAVKHLRADENVDFVQRVWMGESFEEWNQTDAASVNGPRVSTHSDENPPDWGPKAYAYDGGGNIKQFGNDTYRYDDVSRLKQAVVNGVTETYGYDAFGNLTQKQISGEAPSPLVIDSTSNRVANHTYDIAGNVTRDEARTYAYDSLGMMITFYGAGETRRMIYTADDERIGVVTPSWGRWAIRDFEGRALREFRTDQPTNNLNIAEWLWIEDYVYAGGQVVGAETAGPFGNQNTTMPADRRRRHFHLDHLGSVRLITTDARVSLGVHTYYPFGVEQTQIHQEEATFGGNGMIRPEPMRFAGHQRDFYGVWNIDNKHYIDYMHARYYNPHAGRFLSVDPTWASADMGTPQTWNRYAYVRNNPVNRTDPDGRVDGNGMGEPLDWESGGLDRAQQLKISNRTAMGTAIGTAVVVGGFLLRAIFDVASAPDIGPEPEPPRSSSPQKSTDFVVTPNGEAVPIPDGATGPSAPDRGSGMAYQGGSGGKGMDEKTSGVRIMDANKNQGQRVNYMNEQGQTVNPSTGRTIPKTDPAGHQKLEPFDPVAPKKKEQ